MITSIYPVSDLRRRTREIFERIEADEKVFITRNGRSIATMLSMDTYNGMISSDAHTRLSKELREVKKEIRVSSEGKEIRKSERHLNKHKS